MNQLLLEDFVRRAIAEDIGDGDHTSLACVPKDLNGKAELLVKEEGILAGIEVVQTVFRLVDPLLNCSIFIQDGSRINPGDIAFSLTGPRQSILKAERLSLNILQRMSGIATQTARYTSLVEGTSAKVLDTRKTTPNLRFIEKEAVKIGGGYNHRMGLYDMIMIKDNHIDFAGGIKKAIDKTVNYLRDTRRELKIEIEVRDFQELKEVLACGRVDRIMLDNFTPEQTREAVHLIDNSFEVESSGGISLETIRKYAETGVDYISVGALTHQIFSLDMSLKAV